MTKDYQYHWMWNTRFYRIWHNMNGRCSRETPRSKNYKDRGIIVKWKDFVSFKNDMYDDYIIHVDKFWEKNTSINRIDNDWNYSKSNCCRSTAKVQMLNTSRNLILEHNGIKKTAKERSDELWINENTIRVRYLRWLDPLHKWKIYKKWSVVIDRKKHCNIHWNNAVKYINFYQRIKILWWKTEKAINTPRLYI